MPSPLTLARGLPVAAPKNAPQAAAVEVVPPADAAPVDMFGSTRAALPNGDASVPHVPGPQVEADALWGGGAARAPDAEVASRAVQLAAARKELADVREKVQAAQARVATAQSSLDAQISTVGSLRSELQGLRTQLEAARTRRGAVGGAATLFGFLLGGPVGAVIGNAAGFGTLASLEAIRQKISAQETALANATATLSNLQQQRTSLGEEAAALAQRSSSLDAKVAALEAAQAPPPNEPPGDALARLNRTRTAVRGLIDGYSALLQDYGQLEARAAELGTQLDTLRAELERNVASARLALESVNAEIRQVLFGLSLSIVSAGAGVGAFTGDQAAALKVAIRSADFVTGSDARRVELLTSALMGAALPSPVAANVASTVVIGLTNDSDAGRAAIRAALAAGSGALSEPHRALVARLLELPSSDPVLGIVNAFLALDAGARQQALETNAALG